MLKILRPRGIRSLKFVPSQVPGAFLPGAFLPGAFFPGAFLPGRFGGHWFPERVRGHWFQENFGVSRSSSRWGGICSQSTCEGIRIRPFFRGIHSPQKLGAFTFYSCMILFSGYQGFYSFMVLFFLVTKLVTYSCMILFFWFSLKKTGNFTINTKYSNIYFFQVHNVNNYHGHWSNRDSKWSHQKPESKSQLRQRRPC